MIRYSGQPLPESPRIAVFANDALGNFVMATPLLQLLDAERKPGWIDYFGGTRTQELQGASDLFDRAFSLLGSNREDLIAVLAERPHYDLLINLESTPFTKTVASLFAGPETLVAGPCMAPGGRGELPFSADERGKLWEDKSWASEDLVHRYPFLRSGFISEIFARLCYLEGDLPPYKVPVEEPERHVPDILIATAASLPEKLWDHEKWAAAIRRLRAEGKSVGLLGAPPSAQAEHWKGATFEALLVGEGMAEDLRGAFTLPQVAGALKKANGVLTLDNGILHLAVAVGTPTVGLFRHGIHHLWAPPSPKLTVLTPGEGKLVDEISVDTAHDALRRRMVEAA